VRSVADLVDFARAGEKPRAAWRVGTEHEKFGLLREGLRPVPYAGENGIAGVLAALAAEGGWREVREGGALIALEASDGGIGISLPSGNRTSLPSGGSTSLPVGGSITLEPGGQLELSGAPLRTIFETCRELHEHLDQLRRVSEPRGIVWISLGANPLHDLAEMPRVPKARYTVMRRYLPPKGELALHMMHLCATVQANLDYASEQDMAEKMRTAMGVSPIVSALFANSALHLGKPSGFVSRRVHVWRHVDPDRCGLLPFVFEPGFGYAAYVEWALDVPMFFVLHEGEYRPVEGFSFRRYLAEGHEGKRATLQDWSLHLSTLFPEVRLKQFLEVRGADAVPASMTCALPALWKGILYDAAARAAAWELVADWSFAEREASLEAVARRGLAAEVGGRAVLPLARELLAIASEGLTRIGDGDGGESDERGFLEPLHEVAERGTSPGQEVLARWEGSWHGSPERLIEYSRY
jgi:glutamate--cysteine ligase